MSDDRSNLHTDSPQSNPYGAPATTAPLSRKPGDSRPINSFNAEALSAGEIDFGSLLTLPLSLFRSQWKSFLLCALTFALIVSGLYLAFIKLGVNPFISLVAGNIINGINNPDQGEALGDALRGGLWKLGTLSAVYWFLFIILNMFLAYLITVRTLHICADTGQPGNVASGPSNSMESGIRPFAQSLHAALRGYWRALLTGLPWTLVVMIGWLLCVLPGWLLLVFGLVWMVSVAAEQRTFSAIPHSFRSMSGRFWKSSGVILIYLVVYYIVYMFCSLPFNYVYSQSMFDIMDPSSGNAGPHTVLGAIMQLFNHPAAHVSNFLNMLALGLYAVLMGITGVIMYLNYTRPETADPAQDSQFNAR
ncbi:MAG: hypothetical protein KDK34_07365 [Leptospiraceae bacterium]|nr:hypothetical protein [Leptospiraceae bacterium]